MYKECASKRCSAVVTYRGAAIRASSDCTQIASTSTSYGVREDNGHILDVVGIYGFAGLGKSTLCKCLCDFYFADFDGKVVYVDLGSSDPSFKRMQHILSRLKGYKYYGLDTSQIQNLLRQEFSSMKDPIFLSIDNILPNRESQDEADFYLTCKFPKGSKIFITSRSRGILENLFSQHNSLSVVIKYIPALELQEATDIFVHEIRNLSNLGISNIEDEVNEFVNMCTIHVKRYHSLMLKRYHPLMLKSLAGYIRCNPDWKRRLKNLQLDDKNEAWERVFKILDITYAFLSEEAKTLFLDLALSYNYAEDIDAWIQSVYSHFGKKKINKIVLQLRDLSFLVEASRLGLHGLVVDFAKHKASQDTDNYLVVEDGAEWPHYFPARSAYRNVSISRCGMINGRLDLRDVEGVEVLHLVDNVGLREVCLSSTTCLHLRSLIVRVPTGTTLRCTIDEDGSTSAVPRPMWLDLQGNVIFSTTRRSITTSFRHFLTSLGKTSSPYNNNPLGSLILGDLRNLEFLSLSGLSLQGIDLNSCAAIRLKHLTLSHLPSLSFIRGLDKSTNLQYLLIFGCEELLELTIPAADYLGRTSLIVGCESLRKISICPTSYVSPEAADYGSLRIRGCPSLSSIDYGSLKITDCPSLSLNDPLSRRYLNVPLYPGLRYSSPQVRDLASLAQWHLLQKINLSGCTSVEVLPDFRTMTSLKILNLSGCTSVEVWPDFGTMTSLGYLDLSCTSLKEWPAGVLSLPHLEYLDIRGCRQLPAEEFIKVITQREHGWHSALVGTLINDLQDGTRDRCSVVDALDSQYPELIDLFSRCCLDSTTESVCGEDLVKVVEAK